MKLATVAQMHAVDRYAIEELNITGVTLMTKAAEHLAAAALELVKPGGCVTIFCGTGNNGGDGIGAAACLLEKGVPVRLFLIGDEDKLTPDAQEMAKRFYGLGGIIEQFMLSFDLDNHLADSAVIIDAIIGIGLTSDLRGEVLSAVSVINSSRALVISADIPTGVHADTGAILGDAVKADITVTFSLAKPGHFVEPGCIYSGKLRVRDIGIPKNVIDDIDSLMYAAMSDSINLPRRRRDTHKGNYGRALIIAGSIGYTGAPALSARAATKMGAGLVSLGVPKSIYDIMAAKLDEEMPFPLPDNGKGRLIANAASEILRHAAQSDVCLIGPGLGMSDDITELVQSLTRIVETPVILDADGLNAIAGNIDILNQAVCPLILTPHPGEFERLRSGLSSGGTGAGMGAGAASGVGARAGAGTGTGGGAGAGVNAGTGAGTGGGAGTNAPLDRLGASREFATKYGCMLVLKGHRTIVALPNGTAYVNTTGGPAMAKGGSGDVLAGMIAALIAQKFPIVHAVAAAVYLHGLSGDMCAAEFGEYSVTASDIINMLPKAIKTVVNVK